MTALSELLHTTELLEAILICLPTRDLLLAQRVSKHWRDLICNSISLQRALFLKPEKGNPLVLAKDDNGAKKYWMRLGGDEEAELCILCRNPLLDPLFRILEADGKDYSLGAGLPLSWRNEGASWRRMLPSQPAIETSAYVGLWGLPEFWCAWYTEKSMPLFCTKDLRIGEIFDILDERYGRFPYGKKKLVIVGLDDWVCNDVCRGVKD